MVFVIIILFLICGVFGLVRYQESIEYQKYQENQKSLISIDTDGDGFSDGFEKQMDGYDLSIPNDRYVLLFLQGENETSTGGNETLLANAQINYGKFFEEEGVPPKNITLLIQEEATLSNLHKAIENIADKADRNDIVLISLCSHGMENAIFASEGTIFYSSLDEWIDEIEAKVVIVRIIACESESALPVMEEGPCPRITLIWYGEFFSIIGVRPEYSAKVDADEGDNNGYISIQEISNWYNDPNSKVVMSDISNVAHKTYLTDYKVPS